MEPAPSASALLEQADKAYRAGALDAARTAIRQACGAAPAHLQAWLLRADIAGQSGDLADLVIALEVAAALSGDRRMVASLDLDRAWALYGLGSTGQAARLAQQIDRSALGTERLGLIGGLLDALGRSDAAADPLRRLVVSRPDDPTAWLQLALVHRALGETPQMLAACERAIGRAPGMAQAHGLLAAGRRWSSADNHVERLGAVLQQTLEPLDRARLGFALFKELDDVGETKRAWSALQAASAAARRVFPWSADREAAALRTVTAFSEARSQAPGPTTEPRLPKCIFVVGLPRSGTTLVDRVLAAHSQVRSLGELNTFGQLADRGEGRRPGLYADLATVERMRGADWAEVGRRYREEVRLLSQGEPALTDKNPQNWVFAAAIAEALPDATVVHVSRGPMDSLFGAFKQLFIGEHAWSYDLADLAAHHHNYAATVARWRDRLGDRWVDVRYEDLARRPDVVAPALLRACGLAFEPACLHPESASGAVRTLSSLQVREPINTRSIGGWRRYAEGLEPLRARLQALGAVDAEGEPRGG